MVITIESEIGQKLPDLKLGTLLLRIKTAPSSPELLKLIDAELNQLSKIYTEESIRELETVKATKNAYRVLGKDPNRYRPAAESLLRRVAKEKGIYRINNAVDILNLISSKTGFSICGFDFDKVIGDITLGIGNPEEPYVGIGRGDINIENLPVFRDELSAFGTPTSDSVRTLVSNPTTKLLMIFISFGNQDYLENSMSEAVNLYTKFAEGEVLERLVVGV